MRFFIAFLLIFITIPATTFSQIISNTEISIENITSLEEFLESISTEEEDVNNLLGMIDFFANNPLDLSKTTPSQIAEIPSISYFEAYYISDCIKRTPTITMDSLCDIVKLNKYQHIILALCAVTGADKRHFNAKIRERTMYQIEDPIGFENGKYIGEKYSLYQKYEANYNINFAKYSIGTTINKNTCEKSIYNFLSGYFVLDNKYLKIIGGDFAIQAGMGNIFGPSYTQNKGINTIAPTVEYANKLSPYTSKLDYRIMRGIAAHIEIPINDNIKLASYTWYSNAPRAATLSKDGNYISSLFTSNYYRTETDLSKKNAAFEKNGGTMLELNNCNFNIGALITYFNYTAEIRSTSARAFAGQAGYMSSAFATFFFDNINVASEISLDNNSNVGLKFGTAYKSKKWDFAIHIRSFEENFRSPYGYFFGEFSYPANELGIYTGIVGKIDKKIKLSAFLDWFTSYTNTATVDTNVTGFQIFSQLDYKFNHNTSAYFRINYKNKTFQETVGKLKQPYQRDKINIRTELEHNFTKRLRIRTRAEFVHNNNKNIIDNEIGWAIFLDGEYQIAEWLNIHARTSAFATDNYNSAIWQLEYYYPGYTYISSLYLDGMRSFIALKFKIAQQLDIYVRYANTYKLDIETLGSGNELINSNQQNRISCQIDWKFNTKK